MCASIFEYPQYDDNDRNDEDDYIIDQEFAPVMTLRYNFDSLDEYLITGEKMASEGRLEDAVGILREAVERYPDDATAHYDLGTALLLAFRDDVSRNELWESLSDEEDLLEQAILEFQNAIDRDPYFLSAYNNLARGLAIHGRRDDALLVWERSLQLNPDQEDARADYEMLRTQLSTPPDERDPRSMLLQDTGFDAGPLPHDKDTHSDVNADLPRRDEP